MKEQTQRWRKTPKEADDEALRQKALRREQQVIHQELLWGALTERFNELLRKIEADDWDLLEPKSAQIYEMLAILVCKAARAAFWTGVDVAYSHYQQSHLWAYTGDLLPSVLKEIYHRNREPGKMRGPKKTFKSDRGEFDYGERLKWVWDGDCNRIGRREIATLLARFYYAPIDTTTGGCGGDTEEWEDHLEKCESYVDYDRKYIRERPRPELTSFSVTHNIEIEGTEDLRLASTSFRTVMRAIPLADAQAKTDNLKEQFGSDVKWVSWQKSKYGGFFGCYVKRDGSLWFFKSGCGEPFACKCLNSFPQSWRRMET